MGKIEKEKGYVLYMELTKKKVRKEYDGEMIEKLILKMKYNNMFPIFAKCTECYRSEHGLGIVELPMESFGFEGERSVEIIIHLPSWE